MITLLMSSGFLTIIGVIRYVLKTTYVLSKVRDRVMMGLPKIYLDKREFLKL